MVESRQLLFDRFSGPAVNGWQPLQYVPESSYPLAEDRSFL